MNTDKTLGTLIKFSGFGFMVFYSLLQLRFNRNLVIATSLFIPFLIYGVLNSFDIRAGISDGLRYLFPIIILFYSYAIKKQFPILLKFVVAFVILNFLVQIVNYVNWLRGIDQWFYYEINGEVYYNRVAGIIRGTGVVVFFGFFGFLNLISFFLITNYYHGRFKKTLLAIAVFGILGSMSYKTIGTFLLVLFVYYYKHFIKVLSALAVLVSVVFFSFAEKGILFLESFYLRISLYVTGSKTARSESYRVMIEEITDFNLFGKGVGVFGGPASIKYNSPYYFEKSFNWYDAEWLNLVTTDTFYPHPFVELGIIGAIVYLSVLCVPLMRKKITKNWVFTALIFFAIFFDAIFSFSLNNPEFLMFSLVFAYPILHYYDSKN
ncbi:hypothetical protein N9P44_00540 [Flavobacteriaceae bacterium]|nr:hypothetical protein [Flavobacteriaceae bacterium]